MRIPECHPEKAYEARGLCKACYENLRVYGDSTKRTAKQLRDRIWQKKNYIPKPVKPTQLWADCHPKERNFARGMCSSCYRRWWRFEHNPTYYKYHNAKHKYGLSPEEYDAMLALGCKFCGSLENLCIDHSHITGKVRGTLCKGCNSKLGWYENHKSIIDTYLKENNESTKP